MRTVLIGVSAVGAIILVVQPHAAAPWLVWNTSPSVPIGLYVIDGTSPGRGDVVLARLPRPFAMMAHQRGYLQKTTYLLKPVVAINGDRVCRLGRRIIVRDGFAALAMLHDPKGRHLPGWNGCRVLATGDVFVLARAKHSFDSRYFAELRRSQIVGRAVHVNVSKSANP